MLILLPLTIILGTAVATTCLQDVRRGALLSFSAATIVWVLISRFTYSLPMELNEPEWWGGLAITYVLTGLGVALGVFLRKRNVGRRARA